MIAAQNWSYPVNALPKNLTLQDVWWTSLRATDGAGSIAAKYMCIHLPSASSDEIALFIFSNGGDIYSRPQISDCCAELELSRKRASKESYDAFSPASVRAVRWYKTLPPPLGMHSVPIHRAIDIDETGFFLTKCSSNYGRGHKTCRVRCPSHYRRNDSKVNVILAVEAGNPNIPNHLDGSVARPQK